MKQVVVVGAGVIGVSTGLCILEKTQGVNVTILAEDFVPNITSAAPAGFCELHLVGEGSTELAGRWLADTMRHLERLHDSPEVVHAGVLYTSGYHVRDSQPPEHTDTSQFYHFRDMTEREMAAYPGYKYGHAYTTIVADARQYMPWLMNRFKKLGGTFVKRRVNSLNELVSVYDVIVNCTGLGSYTLLDDRSLVPVRGQVFKVEAPWIKHYLVVDTDRTGGCIYIIPGSDGTLTVGGTHQTGDWNRKVDPKDSEYIWSEACKFIPSLKEAKVLSELVGLRPTRPSVRLELEHIHQGTKTTPVVHNYGHGGSGVSVHWGCALDAVELVRGALNSTASKL